MSQVIPGGVQELWARAWRRWPIGLAVAAVTAVVGLAVTWESPQAYVSRATVLPPSSVTTAVAGQRYITDMQAAINSAVVREDVADDLGVSSSAFGDQVEVRRVRQSTVMEAVMRSPNRLTDAGEALGRLITRAGESLAAPDVAAARAQLDRAKASVASAEDVAVAAKKARDTFLSDREGVTPASELAILGPEMAEARLCATGTIVPAGAVPADCQQRVDDLQAEATELAKADDELAALDRDLAQAESDVSDAERDQRAADAAAARAAAGPVVEVSRSGQKVSQALSLLRRSLAVVAGSVLLGVAVMVALALVIRPAPPRPRPSERPEPEPEPVLTP